MLTTMNYFAPFTTDNSYNISIKCLTKSNLSILFFFTYISTFFLVVFLSIYGTLFEC